MKNNDVYRCSRCKLQMIVTAPGIAGVNPPLCCGIPMTLEKPNTVDAAKEKHVPVIEKNADGMTIVKVGSVTHPSTPEHFIEWIELYDGKHCCRVELKAGDAPEAVFPIPYSTGLTARISCNLHGVWQDR